MLVPERNRRDLADVPKHLLEKVQVTMIKSVVEVLPIVMQPPDHELNESVRPMAPVTSAP